ncbi:MAG: IclR family transcriptional regulator [Alkalispirochaeta sp.]
MKLQPGSSDSPSTRRVLQVLEAVRRHPGARQSQLADSTGIARPTMHRILSVLETEGYVVRIPESGGYRLGLSVIQLAEGVLRGDFVLESVISAADEIARESEETVHVATFRDGECRYVHKRESSQSLRVSMSSALGSVVPLHCTALGKSILSTIERDDRHRLISELPLPRRTDHTITDADTLLHECEYIAQRGYAVDDEENEQGIRCIAVAVRNHLQEPIAAISISVPTVRCPPEAVVKWGSRLVEQVRHLEGLLRLSSSQKFDVGESNGIDIKEQSLYNDS